MPLFNHNKNNSNTSDQFSSSSSSEEESYEGIQQYHRQAIVVDVNDTNNKKLLVDYIGNQVAITLRWNEFNPTGYHDDYWLNLGASAATDYMLLCNPRLVGSYAQTKKDFFLWLKKFNSRQCPHCLRVYTRANSKERHIVKKRCPHLKTGSPNQYTFYCPFQQHQHKK
ncbi:hypothetical protein BDA99DRAFT_597092 [Phascolomyces articulosus]|uniref:Uncharacterized protein n=1 Tax=Phascolomyces articulosus TaxID=60185 RepID=A0AAD5KF74_9FUNG|nr:hypothetical protein BDA99DRAFT_597092 [Phascolomyces articulosus]